MENNKPIIGITKIGANITFSGAMNRTAANFDIVSLCRALAPNFDLHFITKKTRNTLAPKESRVSNIMDIKDDVNSLGLDALFVFNGNLNAYGGYAPHETIAIWQLIESFKGPVFYVHTDGQMRLHQIWPGFEKRGWDSNWSKEQVWITRTDINYLTQARDPDKVIQLSKGSDITIKKENILHFPIEQAILLRPPKFKRPREIQWDLIYGGSFRSGKRRERMLKWYFGHKDPELKVLMFGNLDIGKFGHAGLRPIPVIEGSVPNSHFIGKMRTGLATVIIVDPWYENHWTTLRLYESLIAGTIPFIDFIADRKQYIFGDSPLEDFLYVKRRADLAERIELIKNWDLADEIIGMARSSIASKWNKADYIQSLYELIISKL